MFKLLTQAEAFTQYTARAFEHVGFTVRAINAKGKGFDFALTLNEVAQFAVDVKFYRSKYTKSSLIKTAAIKLLDEAIFSNIPKAILVLSCSVPAQLRMELEHDYQISIVDRIDLLIMTSSLPELNDQIRALLDGEATIGDENSSSVIDRIKDSNKEINNARRPQIKAIGRALGDELKALPQGKKYWRQYEIKCEEILKFLFDGDLSGWHSQKSAVDGHSRYDLICRARPQSDFWTFIIQDLCSRYVLFEFKNYSKYITQGQILTTEKYLLKQALRSVAFVISRKGANKSADLAVQGAMREHGKLLCNLKDEDLLRMLEMKDSGDDPADYLFDMVDNFLMSLPR